MGRKKLGNQESTRLYDDVKDEEITRLREELNRLKISGIDHEQSTSSKCSNYRKPFRDVQDSLQEFNGDKNFRISSWITDFDVMADLMKWTDIERLVYAKKLLVGAAKVALRTRSDLDTFQKLKAFLCDRVKMEK